MLIKIYLILIFYKNIINNLKINMYKIIILLILILAIKNEVWQTEVNGSDINNNITGYAESENIPICDFYLCSERKYRVHFLTGYWSNEFTACQPAGDDSHIDGIAIDGGLEYGGKILNDWLNNATGYNISDKNNGYVGIIGKPLYIVFISGDEYYRIANYTYDSSNEKYVALRVIKNLFDKKYDVKKNESTYNFKNIDIKINLLNTKNIKYAGKITMKIENDTIIYKSYSNSISNSLNKILKEAINLDIKDIESIFEKRLTINGMHNGNIAMNFNWTQKTIEIDLGSKIMPDYYSYRGGFRISIYLKKEDFILSKIKTIFIILFKNFGKKISPNCKEQLLNFNSIKNIDDIITHLDIYSNIAEEVIFFTILSYVLNF